MNDLAGPPNTHRIRTASSAHFADARMAVHTGDLADAPAIVEAAFDWVPPGQRFRVFALAAAAELAVVAGLPDAPRYLDAAAELAVENGWAAACLARARGRYHQDTDALKESVAGWERIGAHFERACTLAFSRTGHGLAVLADLDIVGPACEPLHIPVDQTEPDQVVVRRCPVALRRIAASQ